MYSCKQRHSINKGQSTILNASKINQDMNPESKITSNPKSESTGRIQMFSMNMSENTQASSVSNTPEHSRKEDCRTYTPDKLRLAKHPLCGYQTQSKVGNSSPDRIQSKKTTEGSDINEAKVKYTESNCSEITTDSVLNNSKTDIVYPVAVQNTASECQLPVPSVDPETLSTFEPLIKIIDKIADGQRVPPQITMQYEMLRFCTLRSYPKENKPFITRIAQAGFYYANNGDEVVCYCCARRKSNWDENDVPLEVHRQINPNCRFLMRNAEVNVPIKLSADMASHLRLKSHSNIVGSNESSAKLVSKTSNLAASNERKVNTSQPSGNNTVNRAHGLFVHTAITADKRQSSEDKGYIKPAVAPNTEIRAPPKHLTNVSRDLKKHVDTPIASKSQDHRLRSSTKQPMTQHTSLPKHPKYSSITVRITSFNDYTDLDVAPKSLAEAGLFYAGFGDCVRCFQCAVGLRHWSKEDDPWIEHSRWSKNCSFVRENKGQEFVNLVQMAVQYSQTHGKNDSQGATGGSTAAARGTDSTESLLHTDAAKSLLEMGYHPNIIRRAIDKVLEIYGQTKLTAANILENIFELEEADDANKNESKSIPQDQVQLSTQTIANTIKDEQTNVGLKQISGRNDTMGTAETSSSHEFKDNPKETAVNISKSSDSSASISNIGTPQSITSSRSQIMEKKRIKEENEKLKQQSICTKCKKNDVCIVFLPCGHLVTCKECAPTIRHCIVVNCGKYVKGTVRTYLS